MTDVKKFIDAAIFIAVELNDTANMDDETSISWWQAGNMEAQLFSDRGKLTIGLNIEVPRAYAKYYSVYGYCAAHDIEFIELFNKRDTEEAYAWVEPLDEIITKDQRL